jgi:hypothetical protein
MKAEELKFVHAPLKERYRNEPDDQILQRTMKLSFGDCRIRDWCGGDVLLLHRCANNRKIWLHLRDIFSHPWIDFVKPGDNPGSFAIASETEAMGSIGFITGQT